MDDRLGIHRLGGTVHGSVRCSKNCGRLLINGQACGCTWRAETATDPLIGQVVLLTDKDGRRVLDHGTVTAAERTEDGLELTVQRYPL